MIDMEDKNKSLIKKLVIFGVLCFIGVLYFSAFFESIFTGNGIEYNPIVLLGVIKEHGFPTGPFIILGIIIIFALIYAKLRLSKEMEGMDVLGRLFKMSKKRQSYGDSHFEEPEEYEKVAVIQDAKHAYGTILGQLDDSGKKLIVFRMDSENRLNAHQAIVGASGSGKTYTYTKNFIFQTVKRRESIILTDPDGGLYRDMSKYFEKNGYVVRCFDLRHLDKSDGWDCLSSIFGGNIELNAQLFAQVVISNLVEDTSSIYGTGPKSLLNALILRVAMGDDFPDEEKNIGSVYNMLQHENCEEYLDKMFDEATLNEEAKISLGPYRSFKTGSPNLRGNLITNLSVQLGLFQTETVRRVLSTDDIDLVLPATQPCAYFCLFPDNHDTYKFIVSLFFSMLFIKLIDFADDQPDGKCPIPVNFLLDEFPSIGTIPDFDKKMATIRKRALNVSMIFQDITQLQNNYKDTWVTLLSNCATFISLGINDQYTSEMITKRIGETTIEASTEQHKAMESLFTIWRDHSTGEGKRSLVSFDELYKFGEDNSIILFQNHNPIHARKYPFINHPEAAKLEKTSIKDRPDITDVKARREWRAAEQARVLKYNKEHPLDAVDRSYSGMCEPQRELTLAESIKKSMADALRNVMDRMNEKHDEEHEVETFDDAEWEDISDNSADEQNEGFEDEYVEESFVVDESTGEVVSEPTAKSEVNAASKNPDASENTSKPDAGVEDSSGDSSPSDSEDSAPWDVPDEPESGNVTISGAADDTEQDDIDRVFAGLQEQSDSELEFEATAEPDENSAEMNAPTTKKPAKTQKKEDAVEPCVSSKSVEQASTSVFGGIEKEKPPMVVDNSKFKKREPEPTKQGSDGDDNEKVITHASAKPSRKKIVPGASSCSLNTPEVKTNMKAPPGKKKHSDE